MADHSPKKVSPVWHSDVPGMLGCALALPTVCILTGVLLPVLGAIRQADAWNLFVTGLALAVTGVLLLGYARWPLYRQKRFCCFGSRLLDAPHRRCYRAAYVLIIAAILLLLLVLAKLHRESQSDALTWIIHENRLMPVAAEHSQPNLHIRNFMITCFGL